MRLAILILLATLAALPSEIQIVVRDQARNVVSSTILVTNDEVLFKLEEWRLRKVESCTPGEKPGEPCTPVRKRESRSVTGSGGQSVFPPAELAAELAKMNTAELSKRKRNQDAKTHHSTVG